MRIAHLLSASAFFVLAACGQAAAPSEAEAQTAAAISPADQAAMLGQSPNAQGQVENECGEMITPQFLNVDLAAMSAAACCWS
ncbi:MAG: hypothetical protein R3C25_06665 [Hyphomonadaceae bacterium]